MSFASHLLTPAALTKGSKQTILLMRLKWRVIRSNKSKALLWIGVVTLLLGIFLVSNAGYFIRNLAQDEDATGTAQQVALTYLAEFSQGQLGTIGATTLGIALLSSLIAPFTGAVSTSLLPYISLSSVRSSNAHRFTDSIVTQFVSAVALLQLMALTTISSLLTIQGGRAWGMLFTWSVWPLFIMMSVFSLWLAEYLHRRYGGRIRLTILSSIAAMVGIALLLDPNHGQTVFGLGTFYAEVVQHIDLMYSSMQKIVAFGSVGLLLGFLIFAAGTMASVALALPERNSTDATLKKRHARKSSPYPEIEIFLILLSQIWRNAETKRPLLAATFLGVVAAFATSANFTITTTFTVMAPVVVALAWGVNVFGLLGSGVTWLASQPRVFANLPWLIALTQISVTLGIFSAIWLPTFLTGRAELSDIPSIVCSAIATTFLVSRSSLTKAIKYPYPTNAGIRGEAIVPPAATLNYTLRLACWAGQYGVIILAVDNVLIEFSMAALAIGWSCLRINRENEKWKNPAVRMKVINAVGK